MTRSTQIPQPAIIMPVCPVGTKRAVAAGVARGPHELERRRHLPDGAVVADGQHDRRGDVVDVAVEERHLGRLAHVPDRGRGGGRGDAKLAIVAEHLVQSADDLEPRGDRVEHRGAPVRRQRATLRRRPDQQRGRRVLQRGGHALDDRCVALQMRKHVAHAAPGARGVDDGDDLVGAVADHAVRGLGVGRETVRREHGVAPAHAALAITPRPGRSGSTSLPRS